VGVEKYRTEFTKRIKNKKLISNHSEKQKAAQFFTRTETKF
jgi:hypothetical protein